MRRIDRKGMSLLGELIITVIIIGLVLWLLFYIFGWSLIPGWKSTVTCPGTCVAKDKPCDTGSAEDGARSAACGKKDSSQMKCCMAPEDYYSSKNTTATGSGGTGSSSTSAPDIVVQNGDDPTLPYFNPWDRINRYPGETASFTIWVTGKNTICSINLRTVTRDPITNDIKDTTPVMPAPPWTVTRQKCDVANKKIIKITPTAADVGKEFKLDVLVYSGTDPKLDAVESTTILLSVIAVQNVHKAGSSPTLQMLETNNPALVFKNSAGKYLYWYEQDPGIITFPVTSDSGYYATYKMWNNIDSVDPKCQIIGTPLCMTVQTPHTSPSPCGVGNEAKLFFDMGACVSDLQVGGTKSVSFTMNTYSGDTKTGTFNQKFIVTRAGSITGGPTCGSAPTSNLQIALVDANGNEGQSINSNTISRKCTDSSDVFDVWDPCLNTQCTTKVTDMQGNQNIYTYVSGLNPTVPAPCTESSKKQVIVSYPQGCTAVAKSIILGATPADNTGSGTARVIIQLSP